MMQYMPHVSRNKLDKKVEDNLTKTLELVLTRLTKEEEVKGFLLSLLSPTERLMLAKRLAVAILLKEGLTDSRISITLNVTRDTVSRMRLFLEARGEGYDFALKKLQDEKLMQDLKKLLLNLAAYTTRAAGGRVKPGIF
jgi:uncharacterized protein YerC